MANVTMRDIAEKLGVSIVSVSKALTGKEGVSEELREKVKKEADRLGYRYNLGAKGLKQIKGYSSRVLREEFPCLKSRLPSLWTNSYFVSTVGGAPLAVIKQYIENQKNV